MRFHASFSDLITFPAKRKVVEFLLSHEAPMSEREIASVLGISHMTVNRTMRELEEMNVVHYTSVGNAHLWTVNRKSCQYEIYAKIKDFLDNLPDPLSCLKSMIIKKIPKRLVLRIVLFGSVARGEEESDSDIDLFLLVKNNQDKKDLDHYLQKLSLDCLDVFGNRLSPYTLTEKQLKEKQGLDIISGIEEGIEIYSKEKSLR